MIESNLKYLREANKLTQTDLAQILGVSRSTYANYEKGKFELLASHLSKISAYFKISIDDFLTKDLRAPLSVQMPKHKNHILSDDIRILPITISENSKSNIELVPAKAVAGYLSGMNDPLYISELPRFSLPKFNQGTYRAFEISGDSMPPLQDGYIVIGKYIEHARDLKSEKRYILVIRNEGVVFKKVICELNKNEELILASDNPEFSPYSVSLTDVMEAWEFSAFIGFPGKIDMSHYLLEKLDDIQQQIALLTTTKA